MLPGHVGESWLQSLWLQIYYRANSAAAQAPVSPPSAPNPSLSKAFPQHPEYPACLTNCQRPWNLQGNPLLREICLGVFLLCCWKNAQGRANVPAELWFCHQDVLEAFPSQWKDSLSIAGCPLPLPVLFFFFFLFARSCVHLYTLWTQGQPWRY